MSIFGKIWNHAKNLFGHLRNGATWLMNKVRPQQQPEYKERNLEDIMEEYKQKQAQSNKKEIVLGGRKYNFEKDGMKLVDDIGYDPLFNAVTNRILY